MTGPMVILAFFSVVSGWVGIPEGFGLPLRDYFAEFVAPSDIATETLALEPHNFSFWLAALSVVVAAGGIALAYVLYVRQPSRATSLAQRFSGVHRFLDKGWYFDALYGAVFVRGADAMARATRAFDRQALGRFVTGFGRGVAGLGERIKPLQSGGVQTYALFIILSVLVIGAIVGADFLFLMAALIALVTVAAVAVGVRL